MLIAGSIVSFLPIRIWWVRRTLLFEYSLSDDSKFEVSDSAKDELKEKFQAGMTSPNLGEGFIFGWALLLSWYVLRGVWFLIECILYGVLILITSPIMFYRWCGTNLDWRVYRDWSFDAPWVTSGFDRVDSLYNTLNEIEAEYLEKVQSTS